MNNDLRQFAKEKKQKKQSALDLLYGSYHTKTVEVAKGRSWTIQPLLDGHWFEIIGTPLGAFMTAQADGKESDATVEEQQEWIRFVVSCGVIAFNGEHIKIVDKQPYECDRSKNEVSLYFLNGLERSELANQILELTQPASEVAEAQTFPEASENERRKTESAQDSPVEQSLNYPPV